MKEEKNLKQKKKAVGVLAVSLLVAGSAFLAAGCGGSSTEAADTSTQGTQAQAQTQAAGQGGMSVTEPDLTGVPVYPGAEKETMAMGGPGGSGGAPPSGSTDSSGSTTGTPPAPPSGSTSGSGDSSGSMPTPPSGGGSDSGSGSGAPSGGMASMSMVRYTTSDDADTVAAWYRSQLSSLDGFTESTGTFGPQNETQTIFAFDNDGTTITIMIGAGMPGQNGTSGGTSITYTEGEMPAQPSGQPSGQSS